MDTKCLQKHLQHDYKQRLHNSFSFDVILKSIRERLHCWNWRNLTVFGRREIIKLFVVPVFMYRAGLVCIHKYIVKEAKKIIFNFISKGKDKVNRSALISDVENGGLKAFHLESIFRTPRILCAKNSQTRNKNNSSELLKTSWWQINFKL